MIISICGTPCTGKTSVAKLLAKRLGYKYIDLNEIAQKKNCYAGYDKKRKAKIVDTELVQKEIDKMDNRNLVLDSHYSHDIKNDLTVILRTNPSELRGRMKRKGWGKEKIEENIEAEIMEVCKTEALEYGRKVLEIDTTGKKPYSVVEEIIEKIQPR